MPFHSEAAFRTPYITTHADHVTRQAQAEQAKRAALIAKATARQAERDGFTIGDKCDVAAFVR